MKFWTKCLVSTLAVASLSGAAMAQNYTHLHSPKDAVWGWLPLEDPFDLEKKRFLFGAQNKDNTTLHLLCDYSDKYTLSFSIPEILDKDFFQENKIEILLRFDLSENLAVAIVTAMRHLKKDNVTLLLAEDIDPRLLLRFRATNKSVFATVRVEGEKLYHTSSFASIGIKTMQRTADTFAKKCMSRPKSPTEPKIMKGDPS